MSQPMRAPQAFPEKTETRAPGPIDHEKAMPSFDYAGMMRQLALSGGKNYLSLVQEMYALKFGPGRLAPVEYFHYGLFDDAMTPAQKRAFVGTNLRAEINKAMLDTEYFGLGKDKIAFYAWLRGLGMPGPETRALFHPSRFLAGAARLHDRDALAAYLRDGAHYPFFSKPANLTASVGAASVERYHAESDEIELVTGARFPVMRFVEEAQRYFESGYLIQERLRPHAALAAAHGPRLSTVRMMVLADNGPARIIRATWRVPAGDAIADVLWRGNLMAALNVETGAVRRLIVGRGLSRQEVDTHPDTHVKLTGFALPMWRELCEMTLDAAAAAPNLALTGWDTALTDRGPVIVELEPDGGDPTVTQLASGEGLLDGPYGEFLARRRAQLKKK